MKRLYTFALSLALVLSLSAPAFAASADVYTDAGSIHNWEAVATLTQLNFFEGKDNGSFDPAALLSRAECAKLLFVFHHGQPVEPFPSDGYAFNDIYDHWARTYIRCSAPLMDARGDGSFDPDGTVNCLELAKGLLITLGYDQHAYMLVGSKWAQRADELARATQLFDGVAEEFLPFDSGEGLTAAPISREAAAQILYNALKVVPKEEVQADPENDVWQYVDVTVKESTSDYGRPIPYLEYKFSLTDFPAIPAQPQ